MGPTEDGPGRWHRIDDLLGQVLEKEPGERAAFIDRACGADTDLANRVLRLLEHVDEADRFFDEVAALVGAAVVESEEEQVHARLGPFRLLRVLGRGSTGVVYLAEDTRLGRRVALKVLPRLGDTDLGTKDRLLHEARLVSSLDHPNIATLFEADESEQGRFYMAFEFHPGETLQERITRGPLPLGEVLRIGAQVAGALQAAHRAGIVHRDVKPSNVLLTREGDVRLLDFGVASAIREGGPGGGEAPATDVVPSPAGTSPRGGTPAYMSPEQVLGGDVDARTDLWALGVMLYEMSLGRRPFSGDDAEALARSILDDRPAEASSSGRRLPEDLARIVTRLLEKDPGGRYPTAGALLEDLRPLARAPDAGLRRNRHALVLGTVLATLAVAGGVALAGGGLPSGVSARDRNRPAATQDVDTLVALAHVHRGRRSPENLATARSYFTRALELDPSSPSALGGLAITLVQMGDWGYLPPDDAFPPAEAAARRALELDRESAEAHAALAGVALFYHRDWREAERLARRALELDPSTPTARSRLAKTLLVQGRGTEPMPPSPRVSDLELAPGLPEMGRAFPAYFRGDPETAAEEALRAREFDEGIWQAHWLSCAALVAADHLGRATAACDRALTRFPTNPMVLGVSGYAYALAGHRDRAEVALVRLEELEDELYVRPALYAAVLGALGRHDEAFAWLDRAFTENDALLIEIHAPLFEPLQADPRFEPFLGRMGLGPI